MFFVCFRIADKRFWVLVTMTVNNCINLNQSEANKTRTTPHTSPISSHCPRAASEIGTYGICMEENGTDWVDEFPWNFKGILLEKCYFVQA